MKTEQGEQRPRVIDLTHLGDEYEEVLSHFVDHGVPTDNAVKLARAQCAAGDSSSPALTKSESSSS